MFQSNHSHHTKSLIAKQFSRAAQHYDTTAKIQLDIAHDAIAMLPQFNHKLLDIGCGTGRVTQLLTEMSEQVLAVDLAFGMLHHAQAVDNPKTHSPIVWLQGDAEQLPIKTAIIDGIFSSMVLQWCSKPHQVMREISRVLKPHGQCVLAIMTEGSLQELSQTWLQLDDARHVNTFHSSDIWQQAAMGCGLQVIFKQQRYQSWHENIRHLLASIKRIGANVLVEQNNTKGQVRRLTRRQLIALEKIYFTQFGVNQRLPLSYDITFLRCQKPKG